MVSHPHSKEFFLRFKPDFFCSNLCPLSLDFPFINPCWLLLTIFLSCPCLEMTARRICSITYPGIEVRLTGLLFPGSSFSSTRSLKCLSVPVVTASVEHGYKLRGQRTLQHLSFLPEEHLVPCALSVTNLGGQGLCSALSLHPQSSCMLPFPRGRLSTWAEGEPQFTVQGLWSVWFSWYDHTKCNAVL